MNRLEDIKAYGYTENEAQFMLKVIIAIEDALRHKVDQIVGKR